MPRSRTRGRTGRRHPLAGLLAVGIAAVVAGSRSFAAIGLWAADAGPEVSGRLVIAVDGKAVRDAKNKEGKAPHLVAALADGSARSSARSPLTRSRTRSPRCGTC